MNARARTPDHVDPGGRLHAVVGSASPPGLPRRAARPSTDRPHRAVERVSPAASSPDGPRPPEPPQPDSGESPAEDEPTGQLAGNVAPSIAGRLVRLGRAHAGILGVVIAVALVLTGTRLMAARGHDITAPVPSPVLTPAQTATASAAPSIPASPSSPPRQVVVHVVGAVLSPGVVRIPVGARVTDAITAAGGLTPDADSAELNMAAVVPDGAQIVIGTTAQPRGELRTTGAGPAPAPGAPGSGSAAASAPTLNLNTATVSQLESLPGVGPVTAQRIADWRDEHGGFTKVEQLQEVSGIGPKTYAQLAPHVHV